MLSLMEVEQYRLTTLSILVSRGANVYHCSLRKDKCLALLLVSLLTREMKP